MGPIDQATHSRIWTSATYTPVLNLRFHSVQEYSSALVHADNHSSAKMHIILLILIVIILILILCIRTTSDFATHRPYGANRNITETEVQKSVLSMKENTISHIFFGTSTKYPRRRNDAHFVMKNTTPRRGRTISLYRVHGTTPLPASALKLIGGSMQMPARQKRSRLHGRISQNFSKNCPLPFLKA